MEKLLSMLLTIVVMVTCFTSLTASASTGFPLEVSFTAGAKQTVTASLLTGEGYADHTLYIPTGWSWKETISDGGAHHGTITSSTSGDRIRSDIYTNSGITYLKRTGNDVAITKLVDIQPGYNYTLSATAYGLSDNGACVSSFAYWLCHKNEDGSYTLINEYLTQNNYEKTLKTPMYKESQRMSTATQTTWIGKSAYTHTFNFSVDVTDNSVNAILVGLGGFGAGNHTNFATFYPGFTVAQGEYKGIETNRKLYYKTEFTGESTTVSVDIPQSDGSTATFEGAVQPDGWTVTAEKTANQAPGPNKPAMTTLTGTGNFAGITENVWTVYGSFISIAKYIDIEPGYTYDVIIDAYAPGLPSTGGYNRLYTSVDLYHKGADGTQTAINTYLSNNSYTKQVATSVYAQAYNGYNTPPANEQFNTGEIKFEIITTISVSDKAANSIKVFLNGPAGRGVNNYVQYGDVKIVKVGAVQGGIIENTRPVAVTYAFEDGINENVQQNISADVETTLSLRPVASTVDSSVNVVSNTGYFKGWQIGTKTYTSEEGKKMLVPDAGTTLTMNALWYTVKNDVVSAAKAQKATLTGGTKVIRFLALVDDSFADYKEAGFVFTTLAENPTIEAGYKPYGTQSIFAKIKSGNAVLKVTDANFVANFTKDASLNPTGIIYANVAIPAGNENIVYYATPYVEKADGTREYGETKAASYAGLAAQDATVE